MSQYDKQPPPPYPDNLRLAKGALVSVGQTTADRTTIPLQYNPETLRRSLQPNEVGAAEGNRSQAVRFTGAAVEMISLEAHMEAIRGVEGGKSRMDHIVQDSISASPGFQGVYPLLAALQLLLYPTTDQVRSYQQTVDGGSVDVVPPLAPRVLFVWGPQRVLPVRLASMAVTEEMFDGELKPVAATVSLEMRVLTYSDVFPDNPDYALFLSHQSNQEALAAQVRQSGGQIHEERIRRG